MAGMNGDKDLGPKEGTSPGKQKLREQLKFLAIAVVISFIFTELIVYWAEMNSGDWDKPKASLKVYRSVDRDYVVEITEMSAQADPGNVNVTLKDPDGNTVEVYHMLMIYGRDLRYDERNFHFDGENIVYRSPNITFVDRDDEHLGLVSEGDYFIIRSGPNGGPAGEGYELVVASTLFEKVIGRVTIPYRVDSSSHKAPLTRWTTEKIDEEMISLDQEQLASNHASIVLFNSVKLSLELQYTGKHDRNLSVVLNYENKTLDERFYELGQDETLQLQFAPSQKTGKRESMAFTVFINDTASEENLLQTRFEIGVFNRAFSPSYVSGSLSLQPMYITLLLFASMAGLKRRGEARKKSL